MHTIKLQLDDNLYENITQNGIDIKEKFKEFLMDFVDDGYPTITTEEAKKRVTDTINKYRNEPQSFTELNDEFWNDTEKRLLQRH